CNRWPTHRSARRSPRRSPPRSLPPSRTNPRRRRLNSNRRDGQGTARGRRWRSSRRGRRGRSQVFDVKAPDLVAPDPDRVGALAGRRGIGAGGDGGHLRGSVPPEVGATVAVAEAELVAVLARDAVEDGARLLDAVAAERRGRRVAVLVQLPLRR